MDSVENNGLDRVDAGDDELDAAWDDVLSDRPQDIGAQPQPAEVMPGERDERSDQAFDFLDKVLAEMSMDVDVHRRRPGQDSAPDEIRLEVVGRDAGRVIGKKGQVLGALQYLVNRVVNRPGRPRRHVVLDAEGYRHRRESSLASMARQLGAQAAQEGKIITFEPMNARDRRIVHVALAKATDVVTKSDGEGEERRVRIIPVRKTP